MSNASDRAYNEVRGKILDGTLEPGSQVIEEEIASSCGISRTPVREAIRRLEGEKLIERDRQRSYVRVWSEDAMRDVFALRLMLEPYIAQRVAAMIDDARLEVLRQTSAIYSWEISREIMDISNVVDQNNRFHQTLLDVTGSDVLEMTVERLVAVPIVPQTLRRYSKPQLRRSLQDHNEMIAAFEARDPAWAHSIMTEHIHRARRAFFAA